MRPMAAALTGALISGVGMYAIGTRAAQNDEPEQTPALVQTMDGQYAYAPAGSLQPLGHSASPAPVQNAMFTPATAPQVVQTAATPRVYRTVQRERVAAQQTVEREAARPNRSWKKTALVIGGSAGTGAGVGAVVGGKKGALIGAAIGGGAASIYEATRR